MNVLFCMKQIGMSIFICKCLNSFKKKYYYLRFKGYNNIVIYLNVPYIEEGLVKGDGEIITEPAIVGRSLHWKR